MADDKNVRHRFTVPSADTVVNEWIENQSNLGFSLRVLIRAFVRQHGNKDATCVEFGEPVARRGRPPKQATINLNGMIPSDDGYYDSDVEEGDISNEQVVSEPVTEAKKVEATHQNVSQQNSVDDFFTNQSVAPKTSPAKPVVAAEASQPIKKTTDGFVDPDDFL